MEFENIVEWCIGIGSISFALHGIIKIQLYLHLNTTTSSSSIFFSVCGSSRFSLFFSSSSSVESVLRCNETDSKLVLIPCSLLLVFLLYDFSRKAIVLQPTCLVQMLKVYTSTVKRTLTDSVGEIFTNIEFDQLSRRQFSNTFLKLSYFLSITVAIAVEKKKKKMKKTLPLKK